MIFIPGNVPSSKNSRILNTKTKRSFPSKATQRYCGESFEAWEANREAFHDMLPTALLPYRVTFKFVRKTRTLFDYVNPLQTVQDLMVRHGWIEDDNVKILLPVLLPYEYNKDNPGVWIGLERIIT